MVSTFQEWRFNIEDKPCSGAKKIRRQRIRGLLEEDQSQSQEELAESLGGGG